MGRNPSGVLLSRWRAWTVALFLFICALFQQTVFGQQLPIPAQGGKMVHDNAGVLSPQTKQQLESFIQRQTDSTSNQIGILIIPSLNGDVIEDYAVRVFQEWKLGQKDNDNGVLLLIAVEDRKVRIEVGYGLEGALTDLTSSRIIRNEIAPRFRVGNYDDGVKAAVVAINQAIKGEYTNESPGQRQRSVGRKNSPLFTVIMVLILIIYLSRRGGGGRGGYWSPRGGTFFGPMMGGGGFGSGGSGWGGGNFGGGGMSGGGGSSGSW